MNLRYLGSIALAGACLIACGDDDGGEKTGGFQSCDEVLAAFEGRDHCVEIAGGDAAALLAVINSDELVPNTTLLLGAGSYSLDNSVRLTTAGTHIIGRGMDETTLDFAPMLAAGVQDDGVYARVGTDFLIQDLTVVDSVKDGIKVEYTDGVVFRRVHATWRAVNSPENGPYGIYPVHVTNVLVEESVASNASDAGLYVGQCQNAIVRNNIVRGNVAGLEIENTQYADVYGNLAEDNTAGIVVFDLPGNPIAGRDIRVFDNIIRDNNRVNFAPGGIVQEIPAGTGTFAMASRRVEIFNNTYENNDTLDIALLSGLVGDGPAEKWALSEDDLIGDWEDLGLILVTPADEDEGTPAYYANYLTSDVYVYGNTFSGSGTKPDLGKNFGALIAGAFANEDSVSSVLYETNDETANAPTTAEEATNDHHICVALEADASLALASMFSGVPALVFSEDLGIFGCEGFTGDPITPLVDSEITRHLEP